MTHDELLGKAMEELRKVGRAFERHADKLGAEVRWPNVDELPKRTIRDAVCISFEANDDRGRIEMVMAARRAR